MCNEWLLKTNFSPQKIRGCTLQEICFWNVEAYFVSVPNLVISIQNVSIAYIKAKGIKVIKFLLNIV